MGRRRAWERGRGQPRLRQGPGTELGGAAKTVLGGTTGLHTATKADALIAAVQLFCGVVASAGGTATAATAHTALQLIGGAASALSGAMSGTASLNVFLES